MQGGSPSVGGGKRRKPAQLSSPGAPFENRKQRSPVCSPSMLGLSPVDPPPRGGEIPRLDLPVSVTSVAETTRSAHAAPVPTSPPHSPQEDLISNTTGIGPDEAYSKDEVQLNKFLKLHPMLSMGESMIPNLNHNRNMYTSQYIVS